MAFKLIAPNPLVLFKMLLCRSFPPPVVLEWISHSVTLHCRIVGFLGLWRGILLFLRFTQRGILLTERI